MERNNNSNNKPIQKQRRNNKNRRPRNNPTNTKNITKIIKEKINTNTRARNLFNRMTKSDADCLQSYIPVLMDPFKCSTGKMPRSSRYGPTYTLLIFLQILTVMLFFNGSQIVSDPRPEQGLPY